MSEKTPCYGCERRTPLCHGSCEDYKRFSQEREKELEAIRKKRNEEDMVISFFVNSVNKCTKNTNANKQKAWKG